MSFYRANAVDWTLASEGIWVDLPGGARIKLRCAHAPVSGDALRKLVLSFPEIDEIMAMDARTPEEIGRKARVLGQLVADVCAVEWEGIDDEKGNEVKTRDELRRLFQQPELIVIVSRLAMIGVTTTHFVPWAADADNDDDVGAVDVGKKRKPQRKRDKDELSKN